MGAALSFVNSVKSCEVLTSLTSLVFVYRVPRVLPSQLLPDGQRLSSMSAAGGAQGEDGAQEHGGTRGRGRWAVVLVTEETQKRKSTMRP